MRSIHPVMVLQVMVLLVGSAVGGAGDTVDGDPIAAWIMYLKKNSPSLKRKAGHGSFLGKTFELESWDEGDRCRERACHTCVSGRKKQCLDCPWPVRLLLRTVCGGCSCRKRIELLVRAAVRLKVSSFQVNATFGSDGQDFPWARPQILFNNVKMTTRPYFE